jgi:choline dehydrogenase
MQHPASDDGTYDYVIVGAGTAGCVLANRLTENPANRVLLLEAGGTDNYHWVQIPVGYLYCIGNPRTDWMMTTAAEPGLGGRSLSYPRGKLLGGCTSINGMIYMRGQAADYDGWRQMGNVGWGWDDVLPYFLKSEDNFRGATPLHGAGGGWRVERQRLSWEILQAVQEGAKEFGIHPRADFNDGNNEGSGFFEVNQRRGVRWSTAKGFLRPAMNRSNLRVVTEALAETVSFDHRRANGVVYVRGGQRFAVKARAGVILAAGSINTPKLMEQSGIGDGERLRHIGINVHHNLPGVGENLQDHLQLRTVFKVRNADTLNTRAASPVGKAAIALQYLVNRSGPMAMAPSQFGMFTRSHPSKETPDLEYHVQPLSTDRLGDPLHTFSAITVSVCNLRPDSLGTCHVTSPDVMAQPEIRPNYLSAQTDRDVAVRALRQARRIMTARALQRFEPEEFLPGVQYESDEDLIQQAGLIGTTIFHPVGTCKMGSDPTAVVDAELRVHGLDGLRIVDASVMPRIVSGNTASPVVMIAEKAADLIRADARDGRSGRRLRPPSIPA